MVVSLVKEEVPTVHTRYGLYGDGSSEDRLLIIGSTDTASQLRLSIVAAPDGLEGWQAWTAAIGFSEEDEYWWVEAYAP